MELGNLRINQLSDKGWLSTRPILMRSIATTPTSSPRSSRTTSVSSSTTNRLWPDGRRPSRDWAGSGRQSSPSCTRRNPAHAAT